MPDARRRAQIALPLIKQLALRADSGETKDETGVQSRVRTTLNHGGKNFHGSEGIVGQVESQRTQHNHGPIGAS